MSINAVKAVSLGPGWEIADLFGSQVQDVIEPVTDPDRPWQRKTNNLGGTEGGMTNGMPLVARFVIKPIATLLNPLPSVDLDTGEGVQAHYGTFRRLPGAAGLRGRRSDDGARPGRRVHGEVRRRFGPGGTPQLRGLCQDRRPAQGLPLAFTAASNAGPADAPNFPIAGDATAPEGARCPLPRLRGRPTPAARSPSRSRSPGCRGGASPGPSTSLIPGPYCTP